MTDGAALYRSILAIRQMILRGSSTPTGWRRTVGPRRPSSSASSANLETITARGTGVHGADRSPRGITPLPNGARNLAERETARRPACRGWCGLVEHDSTRLPPFSGVRGVDPPWCEADPRSGGSTRERLARIPTRWLAVRSISTNQLAELLRHPVLAGLEYLTVQLDATDDPQDEACRLIADSHHLRNVRGLVLTFPVGDAGAASLASSEHFSGLKSLTLDLCGWFTPSAVRRLGSTAWFLGLQSLNMAELSGAAFEELCRLEPFTNLHTLELYESTFPTSAWRGFSRSTAFPRVGEVRQPYRNGRWPGRGTGGCHRFVPRILQLDACAIGNDARSPCASALVRPRSVDSTSVSTGSRRVGFAPSPEAVG